MTDPKENKTGETPNYEEYQKNYSDDGFWEKVKGYAKVAGKSVLEPALKMYYCADDSNTPLWAKTTIYGALGYFILPIDLVPDVVPGFGYTDDLAILAAAISAVTKYLKDEHIQKAQEKLTEWFN